MALETLVGEGKELGGIRGTWFMKCVCQEKQDIRSPVMYISFKNLVSLFTKEAGQNGLENGQSMLCVPTFIEMDLLAGHREYPSSLKSMMAKAERPSHFTTRFILKGKESWT